MLPLPDLAWRHLARLCGQNLTPMYRSIQNMLANDVDHLAKLLLELEPLSKEDLYVANEVSVFVVLVLWLQLINAVQIDENAKASLCFCCVGDNLTCGSNDLPLGYSTPQERPLRKRRRSLSPVCAYIQSTKL